MPLLPTPTNPLRSSRPPAPAPVLAGLGAAAVLALALAGCNDVVEGNSPTKAELLDGRTGQVMDEHVIQQCVPESLVLKVTFSDGSVANFNNRLSTAWTSSDPAVVQVSSGIQTFDGANGGTFVTGSGGVLVPRGNGTATITASFQGLSASTRVRVTAAPTDIRLVRNDLDPFRNGPGLTADQTQTLSPNTALGFDLYATVLGVDQRLSGQAQWDLTTADTSVATLNALSTGTRVVSGIAASTTPQTLTARPPACSTTVSTKVAVTTPTSVTLDRELPGPVRISATPLLQPVVRFLLTANFPDGATQDVSSYGTFTSSEATQLVFGGQLTTTRNFGIGAAVGTPTVSATFNPTASTAGLLTATPLQVPLVADTLTGLAITTPASKTLQLAPGRAAELKVTGTFSSGATHDITRRTLFAATDTNLIGVVSAAADVVNAGLVVAGTTPAGGTYGAGGTTTVTASSAGLTATDTATVTVSPLASP